MSRILRRPMFRGGSTNNGGVMSYAQPRKGYEEAGYVQPGYEEKEEDQIINNTGETYKAFNKIDVKKGSIQDEIYQDYIGRKADPASKFLINFGLNYMSARPRSGKLGLLTTAADAAKKPTEQLYSDIDTERGLRLKVMTALSKGDSKVALEKEARLYVENGVYPDLKTALAAIEQSRRVGKVKGDIDRIDEQFKSYSSKSISEGQEGINKNKAEIFVRDYKKLGKDADKFASSNTFDITKNLTQKPNSIDFTYSKATKPILEQFETGKIYVDANNRMAFEYMGNNIFRPVKKL